MLLQIPWDFTWGRLNWSKFPSQYHFRINKNSNHELQVHSLYAMYLCQRTGRQRKLCTGQLWWSQHSNVHFTSPMSSDLGHRAPTGVWNLQQAWPLLQAQAPYRQYKQITSGKWGRSVHHRLAQGQKEKCSIFPSPVIKWPRPDCYHFKY